MIASTEPSGEDIALSTDELVFLHWTCQVFPCAESPLAFLDDEQREPKDPAGLYADLCARGLVDAESAYATASLAERLTVVAECEARIRLMAADGSCVAKDFYGVGGKYVEYRRTADEHFLGSPLNERELVNVFVSQFGQAATCDDVQALRLSAGDYLVFAVFARDLRDQDKALASPATGDSMSIEEVLAYFDEPETKVVRTPDDDAWQRSVTHLLEADVLVQAGVEYQLHARWHALAREIVADRERLVARYDFIDEQWLVRDLCLYPTATSLYRFDTESDGAVVIEPLTAASLRHSIAGIISGLPPLYA